MERSVLVRRTAPLAVFLAVLAGLIALAARDGGAPRRQRTLNALPLAAGGGTRAAGNAEGAPTAADGKAMYYGGEIVIPDALLNGVPAEGPAYEVGGKAATDRIAALARTLGIDGAVRSDEQGWVVGEGETVLRVMKYAGLPWYLGPDKVAMERGVGVATAAPAQVDPATPEPAPVPAPEPKPVATASGSGEDTPVSSGTSDPGCQTAPDGATTCSGGGSTVDCPKPEDGREPACEPVPEPTKPPQPTDAEARATAQKVFDALGLDGATVTVNDAWSGLEVVAAPVVGGLQTVGFETRVTVEKGPKVQYANGFLGTATLEGTYPLLAPRDAAERGGMWGRPAIMMAPCAPEEPCPTPAPREAKKLRLGLMLMMGYDETKPAFLAPAWLLTFEGTYEEPVLALPDRYIATPPPATDQPAKDDPGTVEGTAVEGTAVDGSSGQGEGTAPNTGTAPS